MATSAVSVAEPEPGTTRTLGALPIEPRTEPRMTTMPTGSIGIPGEHDPAPQHGRMLLLSAWTAVLVLVGLVAAARIFAAILLNSGPGWLVPTGIVIGTLGVVAAGIAFASIHRALWAYSALGVSTAALAANLALLLNYL